MAKAKAAAPDCKVLFRDLPGKYILFDVDAPKFTIVEIDAMHLLMIEARRRDLVGKQATDILTEEHKKYSDESKQQLVSSLQKVLRTGKSHTLNYFRTDIRAKNGKYSRHYFKLEHYPLFDETKKLRYILQSWSDVTREHQAEHKFEITKNHLDQALSIGLIGTWTWHIKKDVVDADKILAKQFGIDEKEVSKGLDPEVFFQAIHPDYREKVRDLLASCLMKGSNFEAEFLTQPAEGPPRWLLSRAKLIHDSRNRPSMLTGVSVDISARKKAEVALEEQSQRATDMSDSLPIILYTATPDGKINYFNKKWKVYTGLEYAKGYGHKWLNLVHPSDVDKAEKAREESIATGDAHEIIIRIRRHDGQYRWHTSRFNPIFDKSGNIIIWFGSITDVDEWHRASSRGERLEHITKALKSQRKELVALNQSKDEFISVASHQLRTPATAVKQYIGMMLEGYVGKLTKEQRTILQTAYDSNERQLDTVNDLLRVAQADAGKVVLHKEKANLVQILAEVIEEQRDKFKKKKQKITFNHKTKTAIGHVDKARIRMVLENLIDNANKYTFEGKQVNVTCENSKNTVLITIADEGVGIDVESLPKLFQKFSRIDNPLSTQAGGTGLGLYWAYKIVELHNGTVTVQSIPDKGTTFTISLPK